MRQAASLPIIFRTMVVLAIVNWLTNWHLPVSKWAMMGWKSNCEYHLSITGAAPVDWEQAGRISYRKTTEAVQQLCT